MANGLLIKICYIDTVISNNIAQTLDGTFIVLIIMSMFRIKLKLGKLIV